MKYFRLKKLILLVALALPLLVSAQSNRKLDTLGNLLYQYSRTYERNPQNADELLVTFVFVNGNSQQAVTFRQEVVDGSFRWISTPGGSQSHETVVEAATANLAPGQGVAWKYAFKPAKGKLEKAALMIMDGHYAVEKIILE